MPLAPTGRLQKRFPSCSPITLFQMAIQRAEAQTSTGLHVDYCNLIQTCCNAIQTLLQLNSNNYNSCDVFIYFAVAGFRGGWRVFAGFGGSYRAQIRRNSDLLVRN
jgi:hypothetical protein